MEKTNDLLHYFSRNKAGPSRIGRGRGKDINLLPGIRDYLNDPNPEDENNINFDSDSSKGEDPVGGDDDVLSVSPLKYAMEMSSPPNNPYRDPILDYEVDLDFGSDFEENEKANLRKSPRTFFRAQGSPPKSLQKKLCG